MFQHLTDLHRLFFGHAGPRLLIKGDTHTKRSFGTDRASGVGEGFRKKTHAIFKTAAEFILAVVDRRIQKLTHQVSLAGENLHAIESGLDEPPAR